MNFYTSNFNSKSILKLFFLIVISSFLFFNICMDLSLEYIASKKTNKNSFVMNKISKSKHMNLQENIKKKDIIFIGSSRTVFHISTDIFNEEGYNIYNFGVSGAEMIDFPYMINQANSLNPKFIAISVPIDHLYNNQTIGTNESVTKDDLAIIYKTQDISLFLDALQSYIKHFHLLFLYSEPINIRINQFYKRFDFIMSVEKKKSEALVSKTSFSSKDCIPFSSNKTSRYDILSCTNGDGVLLGNELDYNHSTTDIQLTQKNINYLMFLNHLFSMIKTKNIKPVLILEPIFQNHNLYDIDDLIDQLNIENLIDNTNLDLDNEYWADNEHLNFRGREEYSNILARQLKAIINK